MLTPVQRNKIIAFAQTHPIELIYLYGSQTTNRRDTLSDFDFAILFEARLSTQDRFDLRLELFPKLAKMINVLEDAIDVVDGTEVPVLLQFNIISGQLLYARNQDIKVSFEATVMSKYHDMHYIYDTYVKDTLNKIKKGVYLERQIPYA